MKKAGIVLFIVLKVGIVYGLQTSTGGLVLRKNTSLEACGSDRGRIPGAGETNKKAINDLYINKLVRHNFNLTVDEKTMVDTVAEKCPYIDGPAVIEARAIQHHWNDTVYYNNDDLCDDNQPKFQNQKTYNLDGEIIVYPNPANNLITLKSNVAGTLVITDITGRKLIEQLITIPLTNIKVEKLMPGIYNLSVYTDEKVVSSVQVIKIQ